MNFVPPNFVCRVAEKDQPEKWRKRLVYGESEEDVVLFLDEKDLIVKPGSVEPYDFEDKWKKKAGKAQKEANEAFDANGGDYKWNSGIWGELKDHLQDLFADKCAYCDARFAKASWGDVEHYRPKSAVSDKDGKPIEHSGYYWLAYDPSNYLPSCEKCNRGGAKSTKFPISGTRAKKRSDPLEKEDPLLLNPYLHDFGQHLKFGTLESKIPGLAISRDNIGEVSIKTYKRNRKDLPKSRRIEQGNAEMEYQQAYMKVIMEKSRQPLDSVNERIESGEREFLQAAKEQINAFMKSIGHQPPF